MPITIYHNPNCSKSKASLQLLNDKGIEPDIFHYLETPPSQEQLQEVINKLGIEAKELIRYKETIAKELDIKTSDKRTQAEWIKLMTENPKLIERPIIISDEKAVIGRPPENINQIV